MVLVGQITASCAYHHNCCCYCVRYWPMLQVVRWGESCTINAIIRTNYCQLYHQYCCCYYVRYWPMLQVDRRDHNP